MDPGARLLTRDPAARGNASRVTPHTAPGDGARRSPSWIDSIDSELTVKGAMDVLDSRERDCVRLRFGADLTQEEIAQRVGVSQVHVSRILRRALEKLRAAVLEGVRDEELLEKVA